MENTPPDFVCYKHAPWPVGHTRMSEGRWVLPLGDLYPHPYWYINPLMPESTQRFIFQIKLELRFPTSREDLFKIIQAFQDRMVNIKAIHAAHKEALRELDYAPSTRTRGDWGSYWGIK